MESQDSIQAVERQISQAKPRAVISLTGQVLEVNEEFTYLCGRSEQELKDNNITDLCKFADTNELLEMMNLLDQLSLDNPQIIWKAPLKSINKTMSLSQEYEIFVKALEKNPKTLDAVIREVRVGKKIRSLSISSEISRSESISSTDDHDSFISRKQNSFYGNNGPQSITIATPLRILVVDDSVTSLKVMCHMITRCNHIVSSATDGLSALELLKHENFDIVLMDINMPNMNGLAASHEFRKLEKSSRKPSFIANNFTASKSIEIESSLSVKLEIDSTILKISPRGNFATTSSSNQSTKIVKASTEMSPARITTLVAMTADISNTIFHEVTNAGFDGFIPKPLTVEKLNEVLSIHSKRVLKTSSTISS